jgi:hypothetical protein
MSAPYTRWKGVSLVTQFGLVRNAQSTNDNTLIQFVPLVSRSWNILTFMCENF